jgi:hypothetical protein
MFVNELYSQFDSIIFFVNTGTRHDTSNPYTSAQ